MLRPAGFFRRFYCPFDTRGCRRPYCQYSHISRGWRGPPTAQQQPLSGSPSPRLGDKMQELKRINETIQSFKTEVEEGEKKLLYDNLVQADCKQSLAPAINDPTGNISSFDQGQIRSASTKDKVHAISTSKDSCQSNKYIIDCSCLVTDLEYDPLLNYSAGLLRSSMEEEDRNDRQKVKMFPGGNLQESAKLPCEKRYGFPSKRSRGSSPVKLEKKLQQSDGNTLVIDTMPVRMSKKPRISKSCKKWKKEECELSFKSTAEAQKSSEKSKSSYIERRRAEGSTVALYINKNDKKETEIKSVTNENSYIPNVKVTTLNEECNPNDQRKHHIWRERNILSHSQMKDEIARETFKQDSVNISVNNETNNMKEQMSNWKTLLNKTHAKTCCEDSSKDRFVLLQDISKKSPDHLGSMQLYKKNEVQNNVQSSPVDLDEKKSFYEDALSESCDKKHDDESVYINVKNEEVIVIDSSEEDNSEEGAEHSDDTVEQCRKFFNEFVEREAQKDKLTKQAFAVQIEANSVSKTNMLLGQKRRIAHTAKFDVNATKEIIVPFKAPLPQQTYHSRILQAQQQAVEIMAAVKSGQAFVAATCSSKKSATVTPTTRIQNMEPMVRLNVFKDQPVGTSSSHMNVLHPGSTLAAVPCRLSNNSVRRIASVPFKVSSRKRSSVVPELGSKVPHDIRQRYINFFVEEFFKVSATVNEAFKKALAEEKAIYDRCGGKNMYLNIAVKTLKKLRDHGRVSSDGKTCQNLSTATGLRKQEEKNDFTGIALYRLLKDYALTEEQMKENGYPEPNPKKPGSAMLCPGSTKPPVYDSSRRVCCRCGEMYRVSSSGNHVRKEECNYHSGRILRHKGGWESRYSCCEGVVGSLGCQVAKLHVHDRRKENIDGFVKTFIKPPPLDGNHGVFAVDCEMCYTTRGLELSRVSVVDPSLQVVYDKVVKPDNEIIDYNSRFSGVTAEDMKNTAISVKDVQAVLLNLFSADTILIGHGLGNGLFALKLFHSNIVDTSVVFPHRLGFPHKRAFRTLIADYLRRIIQDDVGGHDSSEDAAACMELMLWKVREDNKGRR
ncbi:RNA exonuclease 1 homolog [Sphaerodactylus townsendi]|uniref:RNA exonuclease 1 homolog n=1 Tax=Sphaerodactylus townsendi TaxID=933632 RepID=UPI00202727C8|nr:RNA exonuclease 1 homolog [Sphaerodactylus townsendi]